MSYQNIYKGGWFNWSHDAAFAGILTLSARTGGYLISFLSLYVTLASGRFWIVMAFLIHQERAYYKANDGIHFQHQAVLRNTSSPSAAVMKFIKIAWRWRGRSVNPIRRSLPVLAIALFTIGTFRGASILVAEVTQAAGNLTLIRGDDCRWWQQSSSDPFTQGNFRQKLGVDAFAAASYSRDCYEPTSRASSQCGAYAAKNITWNGTTSASCPFSSEVCFDSPNSVFQMDTGPVESHDILGINAKKEDRVTYRRVTTCAPINATAFLTTTTDSAGNKNLSYSFGSLSYLPNSSVTFSYNSRTRDDNIGYELSVHSTGQGAQWDPRISKLDANITIMFLTANSIIYEGPSSDLLFAANQKVNLADGDNTVTYYRPDNLVSVLGCAEQHQICTRSPSATSGLSECTPLGNINTVVPNPQGSFNDHQWATAELILRSIWLSDMFSIVDPRGSSAIRASESLFEIYSSRLDSQQWILEVSNWFSAGLAKVQYALVEMADGPVVYSNISYFPPPDFYQYLCKAQMVRSGEYMNFSIAGLVIILTISTFFIVLSFILDKAVEWIREKVHRGENMSHQWDLDDNLQLQRMAYQGAGQGNWEGHGEAVPITQEIAALQPLLKLYGNEEALTGTKGKPNEQAQIVEEEMERKGSPSDQRTTSKAE